VKRALSLLLLGLAALPAAAREARVVSGTDLTTLVAPTAAQVAGYSNQGYRLTVNDDGTASVEVDLAPLASHQPFDPDAARQGSDPVSRLARALTAGALTRYEATSKVLGWISAHVAYRLDRSADQSAESVLERRTAFCTGYARLAVALLEASGIEAREVPGYVVEAVPGGPPVGFHRWIEVRFEDRGWVYSDPMVSHHFVPATYLRLASEELNGSPGRGQLLDRRDRIRDVDLFASPYPTLAPLRVRPNDDSRRAAALAVRLERAVDGRAILDGGGLRRQLRLAEGEATFLGLEPGQYDLRIEAAGRLTAHKRLTFRNRVLAELEIPVDATEIAHGRNR